MHGDYTRFTFDPAKLYSSVLMQQGRVQLDSDWNEEQEIVDRRLRALVVDALGRRVVSPLTPSAFEVVPTETGFTIGVGRLYVDGLLVENFGAGPREIDPVLGEARGTEPVAYDRQPFLPSPPTLPDPPYLVYLDVWKRDVTAVEDPSLLDPALEGRDTTTRVQVVWQVKALAGVPDDVECDAPEKLGAWRGLLQPSGARLTVEAPKGYQGSENRLYRIEVHDGGAEDAATFKWSRDNASVAARVSRVGADGTELRIESPAVGVDLLQRGDTIEVTSDARELSGTPGEIREIAELDDTPAGLMRVSNPLPVTGGADPEEVERIRRWAAPPSRVERDRAIELEDGITVTFDDVGGGFRPGDYWLIPARLGDGIIEPLEDAPPRGIHHHYCPLAFVASDGSASDCRRSPLGGGTSATLPP